MLALRLKNERQLYRELARHEVGWWKAHHRKDKPELADNMTNLYSLQFNIPYKKAIEAVRFRVEAAGEHDLAEKLEDKKDQRNADIYWSNTENLLERHFEVLMKDIWPRLYEQNSLLSKGLTEDELYRELARYEVGWWKWHHRKDNAKIAENMANLYSLQFNIPYEKAIEAVRFRVEAAGEHDIAEKLEDEKDQRNADIYWSNTENLLEQHFEVLMKDIWPKLYETGIISVV